MARTNMPHHPIDFIDEEQLLAELDRLETRVLEINARLNEIHDAREKLARMVAEEDDIADLMNPAW